MRTLAAFFAVAMFVIPVRAEDAPPKPLSADALVSLKAFARLYGIVGWFHPSNEVPGADWPAIARNGVTAMENATTPAERLAALRTLFQPAAPTLRLYRTGTKPPPVSPWLKPRPGATIAGWRHEGVMLGGNSNVYHSSIVTGVGRMERPLKVDLGGGVSALVPLTLYHDGAGMLPHETGVAPLPDTDQRSGNDRTTRLADVVMLWNTIHHFWPYFDVEAVDWDGERDKALAQAAVDPDEAAFLTTLRRMVAALHDGHGYVNLASRPRLKLPLDWDWVEGKLVVLRGAAPLMRGDVVETIDGQPVRDLAEAIAPTISAATPQWLAYREAEQLIARDSAVPVHLGLRHADGTSANVAVTPEAAKDEPLHRPDRTSLDPVTEMEPGLWYVDLSRAKDLDFAKLSTAKAIVFDLREYPGQAAFAMLAHLSDRILHSGQFNVPVFTRPDQKDVQYTLNAWTISPQAPRLNARLVFLAGGGTISYGESVLGIVGHYRLGAIVGGTSAGTNGNVNVLTLAGGYTVMFTGMRVLTQDGKRFHGIGITPTVPVARTLAGVRAGRDEVLESGLAEARRP